MGLGLGMVLFTELQDHTIKKETELGNYGLRVLGRIPLVVTAEEETIQRRRMFRNWVLGGTAVMVGTGVLSGVAYFVTGLVFFV